MPATRPIETVSNTELYNRWAEVYDHDGNILQSLDSVYLPDLLTKAISLLSLLNSQKPTVTELGCGTGRNTQLLQTLSSSINALDLSPAMLSLARTRCNTSEPTPQFHVFNALDSSASPAVLALPKADLVVSTLVLEHLPLDVFFKTVKGFLRNRGVVIVTNMHAEMGRIGQAGFVDEGSGVKVRGTSFVYEVEDVVDEAKKWGLCVKGGVVEKAIEDDDLKEGVVGARGRKWVGTKCWFGMVLQLEEEG